MIRTSLRGNARRRVQLALALLLVLALEHVPHPVGAAETGPNAGALAPGVTYAWWGPTDTKGWHFRLPVLVLPKIPDPLTKHGVADFPGGGLGETPVTFEVDFTDAVRKTSAEGREGSWPVDDFGRPSSFTFDPSSVRVVAYDRASGAVDPGQGRAGLMPATFAPTFHENKEGRNPVYNATQNAIGTLRWIVPGPFDTERLYFVYFDTLENGAVHRKPALDWTEAELGPLRSVDFLRPATDLYGYFRYGPQGPASRVYVWALYPNTTVTMYRYRFAGFEPSVVPACGAKGVVGLCLSGGRVVDGLVRLDCGPKSGCPGGRDAWEVTTSGEPTEPFFFRIVASRPVHALVGPAETDRGQYETDYWVPSVDSGPLGTDFVVPMLAGPHAVFDTKNGVFAIAGDHDVQINVFHIDDGLGHPQAPVRLSAREGRRLNFQGLSAGDTLFLQSSGSDEKFMVGMLPWWIHHANQGMSIHGAPFGTTMVSTPSGHGGTLALAVVPIESGTVTLYDAEDPARSYPAEAPHALTAGVQNAWTLPEAVFHAGQSDFGGHVWIARSTGAVTTMAGDRGLDLVGGVDGKEFHVFLGVQSTGVDKPEARAFVLPLYPSTRLDVERYDPLRDRMVNVYGKVVGPDTPVSTLIGSPAPLMNGSATDPGHYRVRASKPVIVYRYVESDPSIQSDASGPSAFSYSTYLGGTMRPPLVVVGDLQFYGPLLSWKAKIDQRTVKPGDQVTFTATVVNLGRDAEMKPLLDDVSFVTSKPKGAPDWPVRLSTAFEGRVPGGEARQVTVVVDVPKDAKTDATLDLALVAISGLNDAIRDTTVLQITVQTRFEIEATFRVNNRNTLQTVIDPSTTREFPIRVKNVGSGPDGVTFTMLRANPFGFAADIFYEETPGDEASRQSFLDSQGLPRLGIDGRPVSLPLAPGEEATVYLVVKAPGGSDPAQHNFVIEATSASDSSSRKQLQLVALTNARTALRIRALNATFDVAPGVNATLPVEVQNDGVETAIDMTYRAADLPGWNVTLDPVRFELRSPGVVDPRDGAPLDRRIVNLTVRAGPDAPVGFIFPVEVTAASATRIGDAEPPSAKVLVTATVVNNFTLLVPELLERSVLPGASVEYDLPLLSLANGDFTVSPVATRLPIGWALASGPASRFSLSPGDERSVKVTLATRPNEEAGVYAGEFGFVMEDELGRRGVATAPFAVRVKRHVDYTAVPEGGFVVPPGGTTRARFTVTNTGNVNLSLEVAPTAPAGWTAELVDAKDALLPLAPGASKAVDVRVVAPEDPAGDSVELGLRGDVPLELERTTTFLVTILRDDLVLLDVKALTGSFRVGDPSVFQVTLANNGTVPRTNVDVALRVDGRTVRNVTVRSIAPGDVRTVQIPWNVVPASVVDVVVDAQDAYREEDEANNVRGFDLDAARADAPAPGALAVLAVLGLLAGRRRRWR